MDAFSNTLMTELHREIQSLAIEYPANLKDAEEGFRIAAATLEKLRVFTLAYRFKTADEEIYFFKHTKPLVAAQVVYYSDCYRIILDTPPGAGKKLRKYYGEQLKYLDRSFTENLGLYRYHRSGVASMDTHYFLRSGAVVNISNAALIRSDPGFSTLCDFEVARIHANEMLASFLGRRLQEARKNTPVVAQAFKKPEWTAPKVAMVELIYALHAHGVFNGGNCSLKDLASAFETLFDTELGQYHRIFLEIQARKSNPTRFLDALKEALQRRMDDADKM